MTWRPPRLPSSGEMPSPMQASLVGDALGFKSRPPDHCHVSRHRGHLLQDIVHRPAPAEGLVIALGVKPESADQFAFLGDDSDVRSSHEQSNSAVLVGEADGDVAELAQVAQGDLAEGVDLVSAHAVVDYSWRRRGRGLDQSLEDRDRGLAAESAMGTDVVVVLAEGVELKLQLSQ